MGSIWVLRLCQGTTVHRGGGVTRDCARRVMTGAGGGAGTERRWGLEDLA